MDQSKNVRFILNGKPLVDQAIAAGQVGSLHQAAQRANISYPTAFGWNKPQGADSPVKISLDALAKFLVNGLGYSAEQVGEMKVSDLFTLIDANEVTNEQPAADPA